MKSTSRNTSKAGLTRIELAAVLVALTLLGILAAPMLARAHDNAERIRCMNNLRQIGRGVRQWALEHQERVPWLTPVDEGGTRYPPKSGNAYENWVAFTNELGTDLPKLLVCPADAQTTIAPDWIMLAANPNFGPNSVSYSIGLHAFPERPRSLIAADRNMRDSGGPVSCAPSGVPNARSIIHSDSAVGWNNSIHVNSGHLLLNDGSVFITDSAAMHKALADQSAGDNGALHIQPAR